MIDNNDKKKYEDFFLLATELLQHNLVFPTQEK